jgi:hypothetical protein
LDLADLEIVVNLGLPAAFAKAKAVIAASQNPMDSPAKQSGGRLSNY